MIPDRFRRVADLFEGARTLTPAARREFLDRNADGADLVAEVLALLDAHDQPDGALADTPSAPFARADGPAATDIGPPEGSLVGPYRLGARLGSGGMGTVFRAVVEGEFEGAALGAEVALKVLHPGLLAVPGSLERFRREASIGLRLRHDNVVRTLDLGAAAAGGATVHYLAMDYVPGRTLSDLLRELGSAPEALCRQIGREIARGLSAVHAAGAVHRDVKPENVMVTPDGSVRLMDLGVASVAGETARLTGTRAFVGSFLYAAPEQFDLRGAEGATEVTPRSATREARSAKGGGTRVDHRADLYSLGVLLYEFATGVHPFRSAPRAAGAPYAEARPASEVNPQVSPFLEDLLRTLLAHDPAARPPSAAAVAETLDQGEASPWWRGRVREIRDATQRPLRRMRIARETALHGRGAEMARLRALYERAAAGDGRVVLVRGEAGIGKSRLVDDFLADLTQSGAPPHVLYGGHRPGGAATATGALAAAYRDHFGVEDLDRTLDRLVGPALARAFASLLRGEPPPAGVAPLSNDALQTAFARALHALAGERTTVVVVDDLHFAPAEGRSLFASLAAAASGRRVLLVGTARRSVPHPWVAELERLPHVESVWLERLGTEPLRRILVEALGPDAAVDDLVPHVAKKSDGNPYFAFEILRGLRERGRAVGQARGQSATSVLRRMDIPSTISDLIRARLSVLDADERALLDVAACQGFEFDPVLVAEVLRRDRIGVLQGLAAAERTHHLIRSQGHRSAFDHHQVHETLYADLPDALRAEYHAAIGEALEARAAASAAASSTSGAAAADICRHLLRGGRDERAAVYLEGAFRHLVDTHQHDAAIEIARRAMERPDILPPPRRTALLLDCAHQLAFMGRREEEGRAVEDATRIADELGDVTLRALCRRHLGWHLWALARWDASRAAFAEGLDLARRSGDRFLEAEAIGNVGGVGNETGDFEGARAAYAQQFAIARELGRAGLEVAAAGNLALSLQYLGRYAEARVHFLRAIELCSAAARRLNKAIGLVNLGRLDALLGDPEAGRAALVECLDILREVGELRVEGYALHRLGCVAEQEGSRDEAGRLLLRALALRREIRYPGGVAETLVALGRHRSACGDAEAARTCLDEAGAVAREIGSAGDIVLATCFAARLPGGDVAAGVAALAAHESRMRANDRLEAHFALWRAGGIRAHLDEAKRVLAFLVEHAPPDRRDAMVRRVPLHRDVSSAD